MLINTIYFRSISSIYPHSNASRCKVRQRFPKAIQWNEGEGKNYRANHKEIAEKYLALHKEIRECYFLKNSSIEEIKKISNKVIALDKSEKPEIPSYARKLAKKAIESKDPETDNWFKK